MVHGDPLKGVACSRGGGKSCDGARACQPDGAASPFLPPFGRLRKATWCPQRLPAFCHRARWLLSFTTQRGVQPDLGLGQADD